MNDSLFIARQAGSVQPLAPLPSLQRVGVATAALRRALSAVLGLVGLSLLVILSCALLPRQAHAQSAVTGATVYGKTLVNGVKSCLACHGTPVEDPALAKGASAAAIKAAVLSQARMTPLNGAISDADYNNLAAYIGQTLGITPTYLVVATAPSVTVSASALTFASQNLDSTSPAQTITLGNAAGASAALNIASIGITAGSDFTVSGGTCAAGGGVVAGASCTVAVSFRPTATGARSATLTISHNGAGGTSTVSLAGTGVNTSPAAVLAPMALSFSSTVGNASAPLRVTLSNTGTGTLTLSSLGLGGAQAGEFGLAGSSTCRSGGSVAGGSSCVIDIVFTPAAVGVRNASLTVAHNAAGSPGTVSLSGTATTNPVPGIALDSTAFDFGAQAAGTTGAARTLTVTNSGGATLVLGAIALGGGNAGEFSLGGSCAAGASIAVNASCTVTLAMRPLTLGSKSASLTIASNASTGPASVALSGTGVDIPTPLVDLSQPALGFGTVTLGVHSQARTVTLRNSGSATMSLQRIASSSAEFAVTNDCPQALAVNAACTISVVYTPASANAAEQIVISTNAPSSPNSIVVTGLGTTATMPVLAWQPAATRLDFAATVVGVSSASQSLSLSNQGPGAVTLNSLGTAGADAGSFALASASTCRVGLTLQESGTCTIAISFVPGGTGAKSAGLQIGSSGTPPGDIALAGTGASPGSVSGMLTLSASTLDFSSIAAITGQTTLPLGLAVKNGSAAPATITGISVSGPFAITTGAAGACPSGSSTLAPGGQCSLAVVYAPNVAGASTGSLTVSTANQTLQVALRGQASVATPTLAWQNQLTALTFSSTLAGSTSAAQTLSLSNLGPSEALLAAVTTTGQDAASFVIGAGSSCKAGAVVAAGASCTVQLAFAPASAGAKSASLHVDSNATPAGDVLLSGQGLDPASVVLGTNVSALDFSASSVGLGQSSTPMSVQLFNTSGVAVTVAKIAVTPPFISGASNCPAAPLMLAANAACSIAVSYAPTSSGSASGSLTISTSTGQIIVIPLSGLSNPPAGTTPALTWQAGTPQPLSFDATTVGGTSAAMTLTLSNAGPGTAIFTALETTGSDAASFSVTGGGTCSVYAPLPQGASCTLQVVFAPAAAGSLGAQLRIASNASAPATVSLAGVGQAAGIAPASLALDYLSLGFQAASQTRSDAQEVSVINTGGVPLALASIGTSGPFAVVSGGSSVAGACAVPQTLAAGASCKLTVVFNAPQAAGRSDGVLTIQSAGGQTGTVALQGLAVVTNAGAADAGKGGGAASPWLVALLALAVIALARKAR